MNRTKSFFDQVWDYSIDLPGTALTIRGHSRGSERSCFHIPELKLYFDAGIHRGRGMAQFLFITHGHTDHSGQLPTFVSGLRVNGLDPPQIYVPAEVKQLFQNYMDSSYRMKRSNSKIRGTYKVTGALPEDIIDLSKNKMYVKVYQLYHNVPTRGYGICRKADKLKLCYLGRTGKEIAELRKSGVEITEEFHTKLFAYICDTTIRVFMEQPEILQFKYVMVECTFFCAESKETMGEHIHWDDLRPFIVGNPDTTFILIHFSMRYKWEDIEVFFAKQDIKNIIVWMN
jgi:ribonuclease Z